VWDGAHTSIDYCYYFFDVGIAINPCSRKRITVGGRFVLIPADAAHATRHQLKPKYAVPMHDGTNPHLKGTPKQYIKAPGDSAAEVINMKMGGTVRF
jgi:L-ascorbate metabolism protein UlaG (beta-lactamase superfamily)